MIVERGRFFDLFLDFLLEKNEKFRAFMLLLTQLNWVSLLTSKEIVSHQHNLKAWQTTNRIKRNFLRILTIQRIFLLEQHSIKFIKKFSHKNYFEHTINHRNSIKNIWDHPSSLQNPQFKYSTFEPFSDYK